MVNLLNVAEKMANGESQAPTVSLTQEACLHERDAFADCHDCFSICPKDAITAGKPPTLEPEECVTCLACLPICPVGAYSSFDAVPDLLQCAAYLDAAHVEIVCTNNVSRRAAAHSPSGAVAIEICGCLAGLGVGSYLALVAQGLKQVDARIEACEACPWADLRHQIENQVAQAQAWLAIWERPESVKLVGEEDQGWVARPVHKASVPPISRRDLLRGLRRSTTLKEPLPIPDGNQPFRERLRLLQVLQRWPIPANEHVADRSLLEEAGFALLTVDDSCSACGTCSRACPVGALELDTENEHFWLNFAPQVCIGCDICAHLCPEQAITINHRPQLHDVFAQEDTIAVHSEHFAKCARCRASFVPVDPDVKLCSVCEFRRQNPFGAQTPPGLRRRQQRTNRR